MILVHKLFDTPSYVGIKTKFIIPRGFLPLSLGFIEGCYNEVDLYTCVKCIFKSNNTIFVYKTVK